MGFSAIIVDDSKLTCRTLSDIISRDDRFERTFTANDPYEAKSIIMDNEPDLVILDIGMPRMDGLQFLKIIMERKPIPVVIYSGMAGAGSENASVALQLGAIEVIEKTDSRGRSACLEPDFCNRLASAAQARVKRRVGERPPAFKAPEGFADTPSDVTVLIGASTGGPRALETVLKEIPDSLPPICITQHIPESMTAIMASRLDSLCEANVVEARDGERLLPGHVYLSPGNGHLAIEWRENMGGFYAKIVEGHRINNHCPSVDALFLSASEAKNAHKIVAILMTGMGDDGAAGLLALKNAGAYTVVQSEDTCTIASMPKSAMRLNAHKDVWDLGAISTNIQKAVFAATRSYQHS